MRKRASSAADKPAPVPAGLGTRAPALREALALAQGFARAEKAENTRRAYRSDFALFEAWCRAHRVKALPARPETVAAFIATEAQRTKASTIQRRMAAIRYAHRLSGHASPTDDERVKATERGIRRTLGAVATQKAPATRETLLAMLAFKDRTIADLRDRALLLIGFAGALRRSELVALDVGDVAIARDGLHILIRRSKTRQDGATIAIARGKRACPVQALRAWLRAAAISKGPLFRRVSKVGRVLPARLTAQSVALIVKARAKRAGLDPQQFSAHSLRAGFLTSASKRGASIFKMMDVSRHRSVQALKGYIRDRELFADHAGRGML
jgi:site-specific recombinase XerD